MPENRDTDWDWEDFYKRNNDELVATWGNLANRVLSFAYRHWDGVVPDPGTLGEADTKLLAAVEQGFETVAAELDAVHLRAALAEAMRLAGEVNKYLDQTAPWTTIKTNRAAAACSIYTALRAIDSLKVLFSPFLPFSSERLHRFLGYKTSLFGTQFSETIEDSLGQHLVLRYNPSGAAGKWEPSQLAPGTRLEQPEPLFRKLDPGIIEEERARLSQPNP
jgi:methionyl-tRNA synthetase